MTDKFAHLKSLPRVLEVDLDFIEKKDRHYGASWKSRGGVGAFMMLARKWDRLENILAPEGYDIFSVIERETLAEGADPRSQGQDGTVLAEIRDLRRYLALVEAEMVARGTVHVSKVTLGQVFTDFDPDGLTPAQETMARDRARDDQFSVGDPVYLTGDVRRWRVDAVTGTMVDISSTPWGDRQCVHVSRLVHVRGARLVPRDAHLAPRTEVEGSSPRPTTEPPVRPGTPEDGGHHALQEDED